MRPSVGLIVVHTELLPQVLPSWGQPAREADRGCGCFRDQMQNPLCLSKAAEVTEAD